jgi:putative tryptophan/tyrosine transport system substrate-binding protein
MRREFIALLGGAAAAWPLAARAQQRPMPAIGFLDSRSSDGMASRLAAFRQGLKEVGFIEGENVTIIYRWAEDRVDRLPEMASELARQTTVIVTTGGPPTAFAAKAATGFRGGIVLSLMATRLQSINQLKVFSGVHGVMSAPV